MSKRKPDDPTGQSINRNRLMRELLRRISRIQQRVVEYVSSLPSQLRPNRYVYLDVLPLDNAREVNDIIWGEMEMSKEDEEPLPWWWGIPLVEVAYRQGVIQQLTEANRIVATTDNLRGVIPTDNYLTSKPYRDAVRYTVSSAHTSIKSLSEKMATDVLRMVNHGVEAGLSNIQITELVVDRFKVARSNAARIVDTEINTAYNNARIHAVQLIRDETGLDLRVQHISALLPSTRKHHADRHLSVYTPQQQLQWWAQGSNRINCRCSVRSVLRES